MNWPINTIPNSGALPGGFVKLQRMEKNKQYTCLMSMQALLVRPRNLIKKTLPISFSFSSSLFVTNVFQLLV